MGSKPRSKPRVKRCRHVAVEVIVTALVGTNE